MSKNSELIKRLRADAVARGLCYTCRCRFPRPGVRNCDECLARGRRFAHGPGRAKARIRTAKATLGRTAARKAAGTCIRCGRRAAELGYSSCSVCLDLVANRRRRDYAVAVGGKVETRSCSVCGGVGHMASRHDRPGVLP